MLGGDHNGKNYHRPMGNHWLVALLLFPSAVIGDWSDSDSANLYDIDVNVQRIKDSIGYHLGSDVDAIKTTLLEISYDTSWLGSIDDRLSYIYNKLDTINRHIYNAMGKDYAVGSPTPSSDNAIRVTSDAINSRLDLILGALTNRYYGPLYLSTYNTEALLYDDGSYASIYYQFLSDFYDYFSDPTQIKLQNLLLTYSISGTLPFFAGAMLDWDSILERSNDDPDVFGNLIQFFSIGGYYGDAFTYYPYLSSFGKELNYEYGTSDLRINISNFLYSAVNNGVTNHAVLAQLLSRDGLNALIQNVAFSNALSSVVQELSTNQGFNTNDVYVGSYGTNAMDLADIVTNGYDAISGNSSYAEYSESISSDFLSNKVSRFNFNREFDSAIKPFLDEISADGGGDWIVEFGNVTLGDFSFTIPSVTVPHNEIYLGFIDKTLNVLKVLFSFCFFLILWREVGKAAAT